MAFLYIFVGGGLGSVLRYLVSLQITKNFSTNFPLATLISNLAACLFMCVFVYVLKQKFVDSSWFSPLLIVGFCGGFSTFSTFSYENYLLIQQAEYLFLIANILLSLFAGIAVFFVLK